MSQTRQRNIDTLLEDVVTLPSLPTTLARITSLVNDPAVSLAEIGKAISSDPSIALKTLRLVNSAYYGMRQKVTSVNHAVTLLGVKVVKNLVLTATVFETFHRGARDLLRHCVACGVAMRVIVATHSGPVQVLPDDAFAYGLLHDLGKIVFEEFLPKELRQSLALAAERRLPSYLAEREIIGADHAEMGARLVLKWRLPADLASAIGGHHDLDRCETAGVARIAAILAVADCLCTYCALGSMQRAVIEVDERVWAASGIPTLQLPTVVDRFVAELPIVEEMMQLAA